MSLLAWDKEWEIGVESIDHQHKEVIGILNQLHDIDFIKKNGEGLPNTMEKLLKYSRAHCKEEEQLMFEHGYPGYEKHAQLHKDLNEKIARYNERFMSGEKIIPELTRFLKDWIHDHICELDKDFGRFLKERGAV